MNPWLLTVALIASFLLLAYGVEALIDARWPAMRDRWRLLLLIVAAAVFGGVAIWLVN